MLRQKGLVGDSHPDGGCVQFGCEPASQPLFFQVPASAVGSPAGHDEGVTVGAPGPGRGLRLAAVPHQAGPSAAGREEAFHREKAPERWAELRGAMSVWPGRDSGACWEA